MYRQYWQGHRLLMDILGCRLAPNGKLLFTNQDTHSVIHNYVIQSLSNLLFSIPHSGNPCMALLFLKLKDAVHQCLACWRASRHVYIHGHDSITPSGNTVAVVIIASSIRARAHADHPSRVRHLIVDLTESGSHLVRKSPGNNHNI